MLVSTDHHDLLSNFREKCVVETLLKKISYNLELRTKYRNAVANATKTIYPKEMTPVVVLRRLAT